MGLRIRQYSWQLAPDAIRQIRQQVFIDEQQVPETLEWDSADELAEHFLLVLSRRQPVATARLVLSPTGTAHIGRMAVLPEHRGKGYGELLLRHVMGAALEAGSKDLQLSAQQYAIDFYQRSGFHICSDPYDDAGIPHLDMRCLAPERILTALKDGDYPAVLGMDTSTWQIDNELDLIDLTDSVASQARYRLWLYDNLLDHARYDRERFRDILSSLARRHRISEIRLLIHNDRPLVERRHSLVQLMRRIPSKIELRLANRDFPNSKHPFMIADRDALLVRHKMDRPEGILRFANSGRVKQLTDEYEAMWEQARPSAELRELPI
ncbi:MAG: GNAT family N-acetyltransferase [Marinobacter sp.]|nr:GNAT family N-acetyltransferase [Marinobacter sp.]